VTYLAVLLLIASPVEPPALPDWLHPVLLETLKWANEDLQIAARTEPYASFDYEIGYAKTWTRRLWGAPWLHDADRFPPAAPRLALYEARVVWLSERAAVYSWHREAAQDALDAECLAIAPWRLLAVAQDRGRSYAARRMALLELRERLSDDEWFGGRLP
jgi:hypothetical protein